MAQTILCDMGCGQPWAMKIGLPEQPVDQFFCIAHGYAWWLQFMDAIEQASNAANPSEPGDVAEGTVALASRGRRRRPRPEQVAVDSPLRPVVEDAETAPAEDDTAEG